MAHTVLDVRQAAADTSSPVTLRSVYVICVADAEENAAEVTSAASTDWAGTVQVQQKQQEPQLPKQ